MLWGAKHKAGGCWERHFLLFSFLSQEFFIRIYLRLEFEGLHSQLVRTSIFKS